MHRLNWTTGTVLERVRWTLVGALVFAGVGLLISRPAAAWAGGLILALAGLAAHDLRTRTVPNWATFGLGLAALVRLGWNWLHDAVAGEAWLVLAAAWTIALGLWWLRAIGGGDAKLILALVTLLPDAGLAQALLWASLAGGLVTLLLDDGGAGLGRLAALAAQLAVARVPLRRDTIQAAYVARGRPAALWLALGAAAYLLVTTG